MTFSFMLQYILLGVLVIVGVIYLVASFFKKKGAGKSGGACCGCSLSDSCNRKSVKKGKNCSKDLQDSHK